MCKIDLRSGLSFRQGNTVTRPVTMGGENTSTKKPTKAYTMIGLKKL